MMSLAQFFALAFVLIGAGALVIYGFRYRDEKTFNISEHPIYRLMTKEVGRAAEEGSFLHTTLGYGNLTGDQAMTSVAAVQALSTMMGLAAAYGTPPVITTGDPTVYLLADDWMRRAYVRLGNVRHYRPVLVQFTAASPVAYAAMASTYMLDGGVGTNVLLGRFGQEASLLTDSSERRGIYTAGGAVTPQALAAIYPVLSAEKLLMGESLFTGAAATSENSIYKASLWSQNVLRGIVIVSIIVLTVLTMLGIVGK